MNDDDLPVNAELASAYLDGELDTAERALVAADPDAMALADSFARLRQTLGEVEPVTDSIRTAAISAALAEFDRQQVRQAAPVRGPAMATVTALRARWQRSQRVLVGFAAAAVIVVVGLAALNASNGSDSKSSSASATEPPGAVDAQAAAPRIESVAGSSAAASTTAAASADTSSEKMAIVGPAVNNPADLARYAADFDAADATASAATSAAAAGGATPADSQSVPAPATPPAACLTSTDTLLGSISVLGAPSYAVRDNSTGVVRAVDATDCRVLFSTGP